VHQRRGNSNKRVESVRGSCQTKPDVIAAAE
jgi:hypothetical protein